MSLQFPASSAVPSIGGAGAALDRRADFPSTLSTTRPTGEAADAVLRRADMPLDAAATLVALWIAGRPSAAAVGLAVVVHLVAGLSRPQPLPFRIDRVVRPGHVLGHVVLVIGISLVTGAGWLSLATTGVAAALTCVIARTLHVAIVRAARRRGLLGERGILVGSPLERLALADACRRAPHLGIEPTAEADPVSFQCALRSGGVLVPAGDEPSTLLIARSLHDDDAMRSDLRWAVTRGYRVLVESAATPSASGSVEAVPLGGASLVGLPAAPLTYRAWLVKRGFDIVASVLLLVLFAPVLALAALGVKLSSPGPVLFRQTRVGLDGRTFTMLKFRSFPVDHVDDVHSRDHHECPLPFGRFLRRTSVDELPQLLNVVAGEMSLVGPRPERPHFVDDLANAVGDYYDRHRVPGGITGLAQVHGYWGKTSIDERIRFDNQYIDTWHLGRDLAILCRTLPAVVRKSRMTE